ncbi:cytochrome c oxidase assembly protein [Curtobacterium ammoniigenes]|uniref:cytochrome c oxidase assembly protein n=1 Tax=Curtobacterium ammoniigenes TaxID=395387 RepID=UPI00082C4BC5|nr:cytochrome c oxidase assembly protein [Curtobacterium ammoniigenes]
MTGRDISRRRAVPTLVGSSIVAVLVGGAIVGVGSVSAWVAAFATLATWLGVAAVLGSLAVVVLAARSGGRARDHLFATAASGSALWTVAAVVGGAAAFLTDAAAAAPKTQAAAEQMFVRFLGSSSGSAWIVSAIVAAVLTILCFAARSRSAAVGGLALALIGGFALGASAKAAINPVEAARTLLLVGIAVGAGIVIGRSVAAQWSPRTAHATIDARIHPVRATSALWAAIVAVLLAATLIVRGSSAGGAVVGVATAVTAVAAWLLSARSAESARSAGLAGSAGSAGSLMRSGGPALSGAALGFAVALVRSPTVSVPTLTLHTPPAVVLTERSLPPAPSFDALVGTWSLAPGWIAASIIALVMAGGIIRKRSTTRQPVAARRLIPFIVAVLVVVVVAIGPGVAYSRVLISGAVIDLIAFGFVVPALLVASWPVRTRPLVRASPQSRSRRTLRSPVAAAVLFGLLWWMSIDTTLLRAIAANWIARGVVDVLLLALGTAVIAGVLAATPSLRTAPRRTEDSLRAGARRAAVERIERVLAGGIAGGTLIALGVGLSGPQGLLEPGWYGAMGRTWGAPPVADQAAAGAVLIVVGGLVVLTTLAVVFVRRAPTHGVFERGEP